MANLTLADLASRSTRMAAEKKKEEGKEKTGSTKKPFPLHDHKSSPKKD